MSPRVSKASLDEAQATTRRLFQVAQRAREDFDSIAESLGLTPLQGRALLMLERPRPMRALATGLHCDASNVTGLADRLERLGAIERVTGHDRRVKLLSLTAEGERLRDDLAARVAVGSTVTAKLTRSERQQLATLLDKLLS